MRLPLRPSSIFARLRHPELKSHRSVLLHKWRIRSRCIYIVCCRVYAKCVRCTSLLFFQSATSIAAKTPTPRAREHSSRGRPSSDRATSSLHRTQSNFPTRRLRKSRASENQPCALTRAQSRYVFCSVAVLFVLNAHEQAQARVTCETSPHLRRRRRRRWRGALGLRSCVLYRCEAALSPCEIQRRALCHHQQRQRHDDDDQAARRRPRAARDSRVCILCVLCRGGALRWRM